MYDTCNCSYNDVYTLAFDVGLNVLPTRCNAHHKTYVGLIDLWIVCPQPMDVKWHKKECIVGEYVQCLRTPILLEKLKGEFESEKNNMSWGTFPSLQHFEGRGAC